MDRRAAIQLSRRDLLLMLGAGVASAALASECTDAEAGGPIKGGTQSGTQAGKGGTQSGAQAGVQAKPAPVVVKGQPEAPRNVAPKASEPLPYNKPAEPKPVERLVPPTEVPTAVAAPTYTPRAVTPAPETPAFDWLKPFKDVYPYAVYGLTGLLLLGGAAAVARMLPRRRDEVVVRPEPVLVPPAPRPALAAGVPAPEPMIVRPAEPARVDVEPEEEEVVPARVRVAPRPAAAPRPRVVVRPGDAPRRVALPAPRPALPAPRAEGRH